MPPSYVHVDIETTGLNEFRDDIRVISIDGRVFDLYVPKQRLKAIAELEERMKREVFVAHNAQFDIAWLLHKFGLFPEAGVFDTMVAYQVLTAGRHEKSASLAAVCEELLGVRLPKDHQSGGWDGMFLLPEQLEYAARDTRVLPRLREVLTRMLRQDKLWHVFSLEMELLPVLCEMHNRGILIDKDGAYDLLERLDVEAREVYARLPPRLNPRSPLAVARHLGTDDATEDTIRAYLYDHPDDEVAQRILQYKKITKKASYVRKQLLDRLEADGRLHPTFTQTSTATGRFSCKEPNLQQVDRGEDVRGLFVAGEGRRLVLADYAQLELRLAAYLSDDPVMIDAYREGRDLHSETCQRIFGEENKRTRTLSKNINFASVFGGGHGTLVKFAFRNGVVISEEEAKDFHDGFHTAYPALSRWQKKQGNTTAGEYVYTPFGRRRYVPLGRDYCTRINTPVQGCGADGMKIAIVWLYAKGVVPTLTVHDELVVECDAADAQEVKQLVEKSMVYGMYRAMGQDYAHPRVPIEAEGIIARSWAEKK